MELEFYVDQDQVLDRKCLTVGDHVGASLRATPIERTVFRTSRQIRTLRRTGLAEYAFIGRVVDVRVEGESDQSALLHHQIRHQMLVDCGVPLIVTQFLPMPLKGTVSDEAQRLEMDSLWSSSWLGGLAAVRADISFVSPRAFPAHVEGRVLRIRTISEGHLPGEIFDVQDTGQIQIDYDAPDPGILGALVTLGLE